MKGETFCDLGVYRYTDRYTQRLKQFFGSVLAVEALVFLEFVNQTERYALQLLLNQGCLCAISLWLAVCLSDRITWLCEKSSLLNNFGEFQGVKVRRLLNL